MDHTLKTKNDKYSTIKAHVFIFADVLVTSLALFSTEIVIKGTHLTHVQKS